MKKRIKNIIKRLMIKGEEYYTNRYPNITKKEIQILSDLGLELQREHTHGANPGPISVYPLHYDKFVKLATEILEKEK